MSEKLLDLAECLGANVVAGWDSGTEDPGVAFLNGKATSAMQSVGQTMDNIAGAANSVANQINGASALYSSGQQLVQTVSQIDYKAYAKVIKDTAMDVLKREIKDYAKEKVMQVNAEITSAATTYLAQRTAYWTGVHSKTSMSDILAELMSPVDIKMQNTAKQQTNDAFKSGVSELKSKVSAVTNAVDATVSLAQEAISSTLTYMAAGPKFIESNLNKYLNLVIVPAKKEIDKNVEKMIDEAYKAAEATAQQLGKAAGDKISEKTKSIAEKQKANIEKAKVTVVSFAKGLLDLVKKKALALIGA